MNPPKQLYKNKILAALPKAEINRLQPHLSRVELKQEQTLLDGDASHAYFVEDGIASVVVTLENGSTVEVGVIGIDGLVGFLSAGCRLCTGTNVRADCRFGFSRRSRGSEKRV